MAGGQDGGEPNQAQISAKWRVEQFPHTLWQFLTGANWQTEFDCVARSDKVSAHWNSPLGEHLQDNLLWQKHQQNRKSTFIYSATKKPTATAA
jgi:hypothetical protein